jgi:outer membrane protein assembly factor BamB
MVQAFDPVSGAKAWELAIPGGPDLMPMAHGNRLLVGGDGQVMALDPATGKVEWTAKLGKGGGSSEFGLGFLDRNRLVLICEQSRIALDVDSGQELWRQEVGPLRASILTGEGDRFILLESRGKISTSTWMVALDALTGRKAWERKLGNSAFPWAESGVVYCFEKDALLCLDLKEGKPLWQLPFSVPSDPLVSVAINSPILPGDGVMYVAVELSKDQTDSFGTTTTETSLLKAVALKDGKELWSYPLAVPYAQGYILADERGLVYNGIGKKLVRVE